MHNEINLNIKLKSLSHCRNVAPVEKENQNFPKSYVQSTHRQDFHEKYIADKETELSPDQENVQAAEHSVEKKKASSASWMNDSRVGLDFE